MKNSMPVTPAPNAPIRQAGQRGAGRQKQMEYWKGVLGAYAFLLPQILGLLIFSAGAIAASFVISFMNWQLVIPPVWIGLANYIELFNSPKFWQVLRNTVLYTLGYVPPSVILPLLAAILVNQKIKGVVFFRTIYFLPVVTSGVAIALVWGWMYNPSFGMINYILRELFGITGPRWLADPAWALPSLIVIGVWNSLGYHMVIYLAGLQGIPPELSEAVRIDGGGAWHIFWHITLPLITPTMFFILILSIIGSFQIWTITYMLTQGGPADATLTLSYYIFQQGFQWFHMGYAAALAYILFAVVFIVTMIQLKLQSHWVFYQ